MLLGSRVEAFGSGLIVQDQDGPLSLGVSVSSAWFVGTWRMSFVKVGVG